MPGGAGANTTTTPIHPGCNPQPGEESSFSDDDEIVWAVSESEDLEGSTTGLGAIHSDDDFVVLSRRSPASVSRTRTRTSESTASQAGTVKGVPRNSGLLEPHPSLNYPQATDIAVEVARDLSDKDVIGSELANELAKLTVNTESLVGEASGTITPVHKTEPAIHGALPKKKKKEKTPEEIALKKQRRKDRAIKRKEKEMKKKERTPEEIALRKQKQEERTLKKKERTAEEVALKKQRKKERKERKAREKEAKEAERAMPTPDSTPVAPELLKSASTTTLVPSSSTNVDRAALKEEATPVVTAVPLLSPPLEPVSAPVISKPKKNKKAKNAVTKVSEQPDKSTPSPYDEAVSFITSCVDPAA